MANVNVDPGLFTTDVIIEMDDSEVKTLGPEAVAVGSLAAIMSPISVLLSPFLVILGSWVSSVSASLAMAAPEIIQKNQGRGVRVIITIVTAVGIVSGLHVDSL